LIPDLTYNEEKPEMTSECLFFTPTAAGEVRQTREHACVQQVAAATIYLNQFHKRALADMFIITCFLLIQDFQPHPSISVNSLLYRHGLSSLVLFFEKSIKAPVCFMDSAAEMLLQLVQMLVILHVSRHQKILPCYVLRLPCETLISLAAVGAHARL
jgi:hypothetical protein